MSAITYFCLFCLAAIVVSCLRRDADLFSPFRIFGFIWFFAIGLTDLKLSRIQNEWSSLAWVVLFLGVGSFMLGNFLIYAITVAKKKFTVVEIRSIAQRSRINERKLFFVIVLLVVLYTVSLVIETQLMGGLPIFQPNPDVARMSFGVFGLHLFVSSIPAILVLIGEYFFLIKGASLKKLVLSAMAIFVITSYATLLVRLNYIVFIVILAAIAYYSSNSFRPRNVITAIALIVVLFAFVVEIREARYAEHFVYVISDMKYSSDYASLTGPYMYIVMNLENFAKLVSQLDQFSYGYYTFDFVLALTGLKHPIADYFGLLEHSIQIGGFNTFPFINPYYRDFGILGVAALPLSLGFAIGCIYYWMVATARLIAIVAYSTCVFVMVISFFTNPLTMLGLVFVIIVLLASHMFFMDDRLSVEGSV